MTARPDTLPVPVHAPPGQLSLPVLRSETLALAASVYFAVFCNAAFWTAVLRGHTWTEPYTWLYAGAIFLLLVSLQFILLAFLVFRRTARPLLAMLVLLTTAATYFMDRDGIYLDPDMVRTILATDIREVHELMTEDMIPYFLLHGVPPLFLLALVRLRSDPPARGWIIRLMAVLTAATVAIGAMLTISQEFVPTMREQHELRHLITPGNYLASLWRVAVRSERDENRARIPLGTDARRLPPDAHRKPLLLILVVGETVRAENWGLNGYTRQTTPELATLDPVNFPQVSSCGTNTEVSVPCMFSAQGRRHYDESRIRGSESLLHVLAHAGIRVLWRDNQSGCKGVCSGLETQSIRNRKSAPGCDEIGCFDEALLDGLEHEVTATSSDLLIVLHQMGNHGPAYHLRYPPAFRRFTPTCEGNNPGLCSRQEIINTYDNAILYTDHVLARTVAFLESQEKTRETAMIYVSDHGESLGENGLYLHSLPYAIAPATQTRVPMLIWLSPAFTTGLQLDSGCMRLRARAPASHDNLFHTVLGLTGVRTSIYEPALDLTSGCRPAPAT